MTIIVIKDGHIEIFQDDENETVEHEHSNYWCINGQSGVIADILVQLPPQS